MKTIEEKKQQIEANRNRISKFLECDLPIDIIYHNIKILSKHNERLIKEINS